mmetsp:Transcript_30660/g.66929  ORF Transcript_30660/g.66929 Transcript_30660/m.66929 type:complete len:463 (+) Transcript_30660:413-1801(+)
MQIHRRRHELQVVDLAFPSQINPLENLVELRFGHLPHGLLQRTLELLRGDGARLVLVDGLKLLLQALDPVQGHRAPAHLARHGADGHFAHGPRACVRLQRGEHRGVQHDRLAVGSAPPRAHPRVLERGAGGGPQPRVALQQGLHQRLPLGRDALPLRQVEVGALAPEHVEKDVLLRLPVEGHAARQEHVRDDPHAPHVALRAVLVPQHLRGDEVRGPARAAQRPARREPPGEAEVDRLEDAVAAPPVEQEVVGLDVADDHALQVAVRQRPQYLRDDLRHVRLREDTSAIVDAVIQVPPLAQLHHQIDRRLVFVRVLELDDVLLPLNQHEQLHLAVDVFDALRVPYLLLVEHLDSIVRALFRVLAFVNIAIRPLSDLLPQLVVLVKATLEPEPYRWELLSLSGLCLGSCCRRCNCNRCNCNRRGKSSIPGGIGPSMICGNLLWTARMLGASVTVYMCTCCELR